MIEDKQMMKILLTLPTEERLKIAQILIDSADEESEESAHPKNGLLSLAGRYAGGSGNSATRDEIILESEIDPASGLSLR